ncbi:MAG: lipopolysaccharide biosynthesis protein [Deltaproteobacteria bacterium]|nr:lipopolysaccharide biosynthesis protein [Deltaproteobacteria bacterium]
MNRTRELARSSLSILASQGLTTIISIVFIAYFARAFSKEQMAVYATLTMMSGWIGWIGEMGMGTLIEKDVAQLEAAGNHNQAKRLISSVIAYRLGMMAIVTLAFLWASPYFTWRFFGNHEFLPLIRYVVVISFILAVMESLGGVQGATQRFVSSSAIGVTTVLAQRGLCVIGFFTAGIFGFFSGFLAATLLGLALCLLDIHRYLTWNLLPFREIFRQSRGYFGLGMIKVAADQIDRPIVASFLGAEALASYHIAKRLYDNLYGVARAFLVPIGIKFGEVKVEGAEALSSFFHQTQVVVFHLFIPLGFFLIATSKSLLLLYGGEKYASSSPILAAFGFTLMALVIWVMIRQVALRLIPVRYLAIQYLTTSAVTIFSYCLLIPLWGESGIPIAMGLGYIIGLVPTAHQLQKNWSLKLPLRQMLLSSICGLCILGVMFPASMVLPGLRHLVLASVFSMLIYSAWLYFIGPLEVENLFRTFCSRVPLVRGIFSKSHSPSGKIP